VACKVKAHWQWLRYTERRVPEGKKLLLMNLDETSISCAPETRQGLIVVQSSRQARAVVRTQDSRTNFTYVAVICPDPALQETMPHFIIGCKRKVTEAQTQELMNSAQPHVHVWRNGEKAWNNNILMQRILRVISDAVSHRADLQPVLILDVAPCHIHEAVMRKAKSLGIWLVYVPAQVTSLVQPLDTHAFASFKAWLRQEYMKLRGKSVDGLVDRLPWLRVLQRARASFFNQRIWTDSFRDTGARVPVSRLTRALQRFCEPAMARTARAEQPDVNTLSLVWPRNRKMVFASAALFQPMVRQVPGHAPAAKRPLPPPGVSIALASRAHKRACRQFPSRVFDS